jgi:5'(3')-deoxyribonucleotidase
MEENQFIFGVDLDGVCADFYARIREIAAEWLDVEIDSLAREVSYGLDEWGLAPFGGYERLHRFAVTQKELFRTMSPVKDAPRVLRELSTRGIRIRIITHRLFIKHFHQTAITQTVEWLDMHDIPYWDLCFMRDKGAIGADIYIDDSPENLSRFAAQGYRAIIFSNSTNRHLDGLRAGSWGDVRGIVLAEYDEWKKQQHLP